MTESYNGSSNQQRINNNRTTALEQKEALATRVIKRIYWYQICTLDSAVVEAQKM